MALIEGARYALVVADVDSDDMEATINVNGTFICFDDDWCLFSEDIGETAYHVSDIINARMM